MNEGHYHDLSPLKAQVIQPCRAITFHLYNFLPYYSHSEVVIAFLTSPEGVDVVGPRSWMADDILNYIVPDYYNVRYDYFVLKDRLKESLTFEKIDEVVEKHNLSLHVCYDGYELVHILIKHPPVRSHE